MRLILSSKKSIFQFKKIIFFIILTAIFFFIFKTLDNCFRLKTIIVESVERKIDLKGMDNFYQKNLVFLSEAKVKKILLDKNPYFKSIRIKKIFPSTLKLNIEEFNKTLASIEVNSGYFYLSEDGRIQYKSKNKSVSLPVINYYQKFSYNSFEAGDYLNYHDIIVSLYFLQIMLDLGLHPDIIDIKGDNVIVFNLKEKEIIFSLQRPKEKQQYELEKIIKQFKIEGKEFKRLDLRFEKPIVKL